MTNNFYKALGVDRDADAETIKRAYRKQAMKHHPDKGGDVDVFALISLAHSTLSDEDRRAYYDKTGEVHNSPPENFITREAMELVASHLTNAVEQLADKDKIYTNVISDITRHLREENRKVKSAIKRSEIAGKQLRKFGKRIKHAGDDPDIMRGLVKQGEANHKLAVAKNEQVLKVLDKAIELLKGYKFKADKPPQTRECQATTTSFSQNSGFGIWGR